MTQLRCGAFGVMTRAMKVIVTGCTGMVGEGVLLECLDNPAVEQVLALSRRPSGHSHPKLEECLVKDFKDVAAVEERLRGYDACFYCAGVSSVGMNEAQYTAITYDTPLRRGTRHDPVRARRRPEEHPRGAGHPRARSSVSRPELPQHLGREVWPAVVGVAVLGIVVMAPVHRHAVVTALVHHAVGEIVRVAVDGL